MRLSRTEWLTLGLVGLTFGAGALVFPWLPTRVAAHWNFSGAVDGYTSRFWGAFLVPLIGLGLWALFVFLPRVDPQRRNIEQFRRTFDAFIALIFIFLAYIYLLTLGWNFGTRGEIGQWLSPAFALLMFGISELVTNAQPNWSVGIRTPWTLSSPTVWKKTHRLGAVLYKICGGLALLGALLPRAAFFFVLAPAVSASVILFAYSFFAYRAEQSGTARPH